MKRAVSLGVAMALCFGIASWSVAPNAAAAELKAVSDKTLSGFKFPETVVYDPTEKVLYVSQFGGTKLQPGEKDGKGYISKVSLDGKILEKTFLPAHGQVINKPKGMWVDGGHLWVTDIDRVWEFDLKTRKGRHVALPGAQFANDTAMVGDTLYVSDNRSDKLFSVQPANFLGMGGAPKITLVMSGKGVNPNGIYPAKDGGLLMVGFKSADTPRSIFEMTAGGQIKELSKPIGRLDGLYQMADGSLLASDWNSGSIFSWAAASGMTTLAKGFKGPADFAVVPDSGGLLVVVPDLAKSDVRMVQLNR